MSTKLFFDAAEKVVEQKDSVVQIEIKDKHSYFQLEDCTNFICKNGFSRIALQFPDELMTHSTLVATLLENATKTKVYILADTSYGSCCTDEVAASHYNADLIIHYGQTCLSNPGKIPVFYVFGRENFIIDELLTKMKNEFLNSKEQILLLFDVQYKHAVDIATNTIMKHFPNLVISTLAFEKTDPKINEQTSLAGRDFKLESELKDYKILFIGSNDRTLYNMIVSFNRNCVYSFNPKKQILQKEDMDVNKYLMRRFYLIEKAKDAQIIGIVMGTLGVARYEEMVNRLKNVLKIAGKKFYTFVVGKINPAKLANFMEIDIFVLIACPENSLIDSKEFYKPIVTPYEMEIACLKSRPWTGEYVTDFRDLLPGSPFFVNIDHEKLENSDDEPEYSLITGKLRTNNNDTSKSQCSDVATRSSETSLATFSSGTASEYLATRTWQGLQIDSGNTDVKLAVKGRSGIAMNYVNEPEK